MLQLLTLISWRRYVYRRVNAVVSQQLLESVGKNPTLEVLKRNDQCCAPNITLSELEHRQQCGVFKNVFGDDISKPWVSTQGQIDQHKTQSRSDGICTLG